MNSNKIESGVKIAVKYMVLAAAFCWWLWGSSMYFPEWDCHCDDLKGYSLMPLALLAPLALVRYLVWQRTLGWIISISAVWSCIVQWDWLCNGILLLTGDKHGYLHSHDLVCHSLLEWNLAWTFGMVVSAILFIKSRRIGRSLKAPWRWMCMKIVKRRKGT